MKMTPLYAQIKEFVRSNIASGEWREGTRVPSEHALVAKFKVSRMTANRALRELANAGLVKRIAGSGTFVKKISPQTAQIQDRTIADEIIARGCRYGFRIETAVNLLSTPLLNDDFAFTQSSPLFHLCLVHTEDGLPVQLECHFVNTSLVPNFLVQDFTTVTPASFLMSAFQPDEMTQTIAAIMPDAIQQRFLQIRSTEPCLEVRQWRKREGKLGSLTTLLHPASRYSLRSQVVIPAA